MRTRLRPHGRLSIQCLRPITGLAPTNATAGDRKRLTRSSVQTVVGTTQAPRRHPPQFLDGLRRENDDSRHRRFRKTEIRLDLVGSTIWPSPSAGVKRTHQNSGSHDPCQTYGLPRGSRPRISIVGAEAIERRSNPVGVDVRKACGSTGSPTFLSAPSAVLAPLRKIAGANYTASIRHQPGT